MSERAQRGKRKPPRGGTPRRAATRRRVARPRRAGALSLATTQEALGLVTWIMLEGMAEAQWFGDLSPLLGLPPGAYSGSRADYVKALHPDDVERSWQVLRETREGKRSGWRTEERVVWPDGSVHWLETHGRARLAKGRVVEMAGVLRDVTERKAAEQAMRQSNEKYRAVFEAAPDAVAITRAADGRVIEVNDAASRSVRHLRADVIGRSTAELGIWPDPLERERLLARLRQEGRIADHATSLRRSDGSAVEVLLSAMPVTLDGAPCVVWTWRDLTELRRFEQALLASERRYRQLFDEALDGIAILSPDGRIIDANRIILEATGYSRTELLGQHVAKVFDPGELEVRPLLIGKGPLPSGGIRLERTVRRKDGRLLPVEIQAGPLPGGTVQAIVRDISERKRAEEAVRELNVSLERRVRERTAELEAASREMEGFSYSISHDLRAPVRAIAGFAELLRTEHAAALPPQAQRMLGRVEENARYMAQLIDDLLQFARTGRAALQVGEVDMKALSSQVAAELAAASGGRAELDIGDLPPARGDASLLRQVWHNLIGNALKFSRHVERPHVEIRGRRTRDGVEYSVADNGAGFDMQYVDKIFGVFQRLHSSAEFEGTGVGLAIVQRVIEKHGGQISAEGATGRGATFRFSLPG
jgi:PAS domain S-box-containing protein